MFQRVLSFDVWLRIVTFPRKPHRVRPWLLVDLVSRESETTGEFKGVVPGLVDPDQRVDAPVWAPKLTPDTRLGSGDEGGAPPISGSRGRGCPCWRSSGGGTRRS